MIALALLAQLAIVAHGPDTASTCLPISVSAAVRVPGATAPLIELPARSGLQLLTSMVTTRIEPDGGGQPSTITEATAQFASTDAGRIVIPPFVAIVDGRRIASAPIVVDVRPPNSPPPVVLVSATLDRGDGARVDSLIVGQQVDYIVDVLLNQAARERLRRNPTFFPPEMASVLAYDVKIPGGLPRQGRRCFETLRYRRAMFPLFAGRVAIPPAVMTYSLPLSSSFFSREESFEARTDSVRFIAVEPPATDRPRDYAGAVGSMRIDAHLVTPSARMGDPVVLTARIAAVGNVKLLPRPVLPALPWAAVTEGDERVRVDSGGSRISGAKEFDWIVTPHVAGAQTVPVIRYSYYDPDLRKYAVTETAPAVLRVTAGALASNDTLTGPVLPIRVVMRGERSLPISSSPAYWLLLALAPLPAAVRRAGRGIRMRSGGESPARRLRALADDRSAVPARDLRRLFLDALRERVPSVNANHREPLARVLRRAGVSDGAALEAEAMLARLDDAAFSASGHLDARALSEVAEIVEMVDLEAVPTNMSRTLVTGVSILLLASAAVLSASPTDAVRSFDDGVRSYRRGQFAIAESHFLNAIREAPRADDAWANLGAAAWAASDSAQAARAWHHTLRLAPLDGETRERLAALQSLDLRSPAYVAPLSPDLVAWVVLALWMIGWIALAVPHGYRPRMARPVAGGSIALACIGLVLLLEQSDRLEARDLAVLTRGRALLESPASDGTPVVSVAAGQAGRVGAREGSWVRFTVDDARAGWVPANELLAIDPVMPARLTGLEHER